MNETATRLARRALALAALFSIGTSAFLLLVVPGLLLLPPSLESAVTGHLAHILSAASLLALATVAIRLSRHRALLSELARGPRPRSVGAQELAALGLEAGRLSERWLLPYLLLEASLATPLRPSIVDLRTGVSVALLSAICTGAVSLSLYGLMRPLFLAVMELAPRETMQEVIDDADRRGVAGTRIARRLLIAVATPVALVALGSALVASAHARAIEDQTREVTALILEQVVFDKPAKLGFALPSVPVLGTGPLLVTVVAVALAAFLGFALGKAHSTDLKHATDGVRLLGTEAVISGGRLRVRPPRFRIVAQVEAAIEDLAERFRVFAGAQERAILAREAATRTRGLFFASVSHDLKNPLNAILGFCDLVRSGPLTPGQAESLSVIHRRGRELLALIETILDAARVEAGQLSLLIEPSPTEDLFQTTLRKTRELSSEQSIELHFEISPGAEELDMDTVRMSRALATLIAFARRESRGAPIVVRAAPEGRAQDAIWIDVPGRLTAEQLERTLAAAGHPGAGEHRGLALALSLARSVIVLHGGSLGVGSGTGDAPAFLVRMPRRSSRRPV